MARFTINHATLSGNLTRDPELRTLPSGTPVCSLRIASGERIKNDNGDWDDRPMYFNVSIFGGSGEWVARNLRKGDGIAVSGRLRWREWEKDGQRHESVEISADAIMPRAASSASGPVRESPEIRQAHTDIPADSSDLPEPAPVYGNPDDDLPF